MLFIVVKSLKIYYKPGILDSIYIEATSGDLLVTSIWNRNWDTFFSHNLFKNINSYR